MTTDDARSRPSSNWTAGRVAVLIGGSILGLIGLALALGGLALVAAHSFARDDDGYYTTGQERLRTDTYAITSGEIDLGADPVDWTPDDLLGTVRVRIERTNGQPIFVGIGPQSDVDRYLRGVEHAVLTDFSGGSADLETKPGDPPRQPPGDEQFWVAQSEGPGKQSLAWDVESGSWAVVVMNGDTARGITVDADIAAKVGWLLWAGLGVAVIGLLIVGGGVALILVASRRASADPPPGEPAGPRPPSAAT